MLRHLGEIVLNHLIEALALNLLATFRRMRETPDVANRRWNEGILAQGAASWTRRAPRLPTVQLVSYLPKFNGVVHS